MFRVEEIYTFDNTKQGFRVAGCEVLTDVAIPNQYLFALPNTELELFLYKKLMSEYRIHLPYVYSSNYFFTINFSPKTISMHEKSLGNMPDNLYLEITERDNYSRDFSALRQFADRIILDDFGTGSSNMDAVQYINPFGVKIDRKLFSCSSDYLSSLVTELRKHCKVIIAEKVETKDELNMLCKLGVDYFQGFYMSRNKRDSRLVHQF